MVGSLRGFHGVSIALEGYERTAKLLTETFGYRLVEQSGNRFRFAALSEAGTGRIVDLLCKPDGSPGRVAAGSVHHIAFRARDDAEQLVWRKRLVDLGYNVTPVRTKASRNWATICAFRRGWNRRVRRSKKFCRPLKLRPTNETGARLRSRIRAR